MRLKLKDGVKLEELEKFGFKDGIFTHRNGLYMVYVTRNHRYIQMNVESSVIAGSLQCLIYDLAISGLVEKVKESQI